MSKVSSSATHGLVPRLRFPEFVQAAHWPQRALGALVSRQTEKNSDGACQRVLTNSAELGVVDQRDYFDKDIATPGNLTNYWIVRRGDYVYNPRTSVLAPVGPVSRSDVDIGAMSPLYTVFRFCDEHNSFYEHYFHSSHWYMQVRRASNTGARSDRMSITNSDFFAIPVLAPRLAEQQKIADCLASLDDRITAETRQLDALKTHKQGLLQQLFPRENETVPRLRFPAFSSGALWTVCPLDTVIQTVTPPKKLLTRDYQVAGRYPVVDQSATIIAGWTDDATALVTGEFPVIVFGDHTCVVKLVRAPFVQGADGIKILRPKPGVDAEFLYQFLQANPIPQVAYKRHFSILKQRPFRFPKDVTEQRAIANGPSSLDDLIAAQAKKIDLLKQHKRGLMQQLFPVLDEAAA